jgi:hypothetical protein
MGVASLGETGVELVDARTSQETGPQQATHTVLEYRYREPNLPAKPVDPDMDSRGRANHEL